MSVPIIVSAQDLTSDLIDKLKKKIDQQEETNVTDKLKNILGQQDEDTNTTLPPGLATLLSYCITNIDRVEAGEGTDVINELVAAGSIPSIYSGSSCESINHDKAFWVRSENSWISANQALEASHNSEIDELKELANK
jgi:hypothetical protein